MENQISTKYGLATTISMVIGIVIGSGIFFKADDILNTTNGNVSIAIFAFLFVGIGIVFSAVVISQYSVQSPEKGGIISYSQSMLGRKFGFIVGWTMVSIYFPALLSVLAYVCATYIGIFLGISSHSFIMTISLLLLLFTYAINIISPLLAGSVQKLTTVIKLIPLIIIAICGVVFSTPTVALDHTIIDSSLTDGAFLSSLVMIAFTFDGWIVATSISSEIKDSKKNLPLALISGVIVILIVYVLYFIGVVNILGVDQILELGDNYINQAGTIIFGNIGAKLITFTVIVSVYGGLNGMTLAYFRLPQELASSNSIKNIFNMRKITTNSNLSAGAIYFTIPFVTFYFIIQYFASSPDNMLSNIGFDISSIPVILNYIFYTILYLGVLKFINERKTSKIYYLYIALATITSLIVIYGSFSGNGLLYLSCSLIMILLGIPFYKKS